MSKRLGKFIDEYENIHYLNNLIGSGGQGLVYRTEDPDLAVKIIPDHFGEPITDESLVEKYSSDFKRVRLMPLPEGMNIALPVAILKNRAGYIMQLLNEMTPIINLTSSGKHIESISPVEIPKWLSKISENEAKKLVYYCKSGGLRHRLYVLYKCASLLVRIHGNGLVYGDISTSNIFISEDADDLSVWLIDSDNIKFETSNGGNRIFTPKFGAPELVQGKVFGTPASDCYAFAVVAFYLLSMIHPFNGKKIDGTEEIDWADEEIESENVEEKAYAGHFPWVDDRNDDSNSSNKGLPRQLILTDRLADLFENTFGPGRNSPKLRPTTFHWPEALAQAADHTVLCPSCKMSYYYFNHDNPKTDKICCPYCEAHPPKVLLLSSYRWNGIDAPLTTPCWQYIHEFSLDSELAIPRRLFDGFRMEDSDSHEISIQINKKSIKISRSDFGNIDFSVAIHGKQNEFHKFRSQMKIDHVKSEIKFWIYANTSEPRLVRCSISGGK